MERNANVVKRLSNIIYESVKKELIREAEMNFDYLYGYNSGEDITKEVIQYLSWSQMGMSNPTFSIAANKLHEALMSTLYLSHDEEEHRRAFALILNYIRSLNKRIGIKEIITTGGEWELTTNASDEVIYIDTYDFYSGKIDNPQRYGVLFETRDGIEVGKLDYRAGSYKGSSGYYHKSAKMTEEMKQHIYSMGLVPALKVAGSYHENFFFSVGVLPEMVSVIKKFDEDDEWYGSGIYFECEFNEK